MKLLKFWILFTKNTIWVRIFNCYLATNYTNLHKLISANCCNLWLNFSPNVFQLVPFCRFPAHRFFDVLVCGSEIQNQPKLHSDFGELLLLLLLGLAVFVFIDFQHPFGLFFGNKDWRKWTFHNSKMVVVVEYWNQFRLPRNFQILQFFCHFVRRFISTIQYQSTGRNIKHHPTCRHIILHLSWIVLCHRHLLSTYFGRTKLYRLLFIC